MRHISHTKRRSLVFYLMYFVLMKTIFISVQSLINYSYLLYRLLLLTVLSYSSYTATLYTFFLIIYCFIDVHTQCSGSVYNLLAQETWKNKLLMAVASIYTDPGCSPACNRVFFTMWYSYFCILTTLLPPLPHKCDEIHDPRCHILQQHFFIFLFCGLHGVPINK